MTKIIFPLARALFLLILSLPRYRFGRFRLVNWICLYKAQSSRVSLLYEVVPEPRQMERLEDEDKMSGWKRPTEEKKFENTSSTWSNLIWRHKETSSTREIGEDVFFHEKTLVCLRQRLLLSSHRILYPSDTHTPGATAWLALNTIFSTFLAT